MAERQARMMWTDPPYGVDYTGGTGLTIANDQEPVTEALLREVGSPEGIRTPDLFLEREAP